MNRFVKADATIEQRRDVESVLIEYCNQVDRADIEAVSRLFHVDAVVDYGPHHVRTGREAITAMFAEMISSVTATSHHITNLRVVTDGDHLESEAYVMAWHQLRDTGERMDVFGRYHDVFVLVDGQLSIIKRTLLVHGATHRVPFNRLTRGIATGGD